MEKTSKGSWAVKGRQSTPVIGSVCAGHCLCTIECFVLFPSVVLPICH